MAKENTTDQIRQVRNRVHLAGRVAELTVTEGDTKKGIPYISLEGVIQCGYDAVYDVHFKTFSQAKKANGEYLLLLNHVLYPTNLLFYIYLLHWHKRFQQN